MSSNGASGLTAAGSDEVVAPGSSSFDGEIRLVAIDVDGTLLDLSGRIRPNVARAVTAAMAVGCEVVLATGRRLQSVEPIAAELGITTVILTDGTLIYDFQHRRPLYERTLSPKLVKLGVDLTVAVGISPVLYESPIVGGRMIAGPHDIEGPETALFLGHRTDVIRLPIDDLGRVERVIAIISIGDEEQVDRLDASGREYGEFAMVRWHPSTVGYHHNTVTFAPLETSKGHALRWLAAERKIPISSTLAIGDYENDVSLVSAAGIGIAMGNAVPSVKQVAREVVADNENDGVAEAIDRWVFGATKVTVAD